ncbi:class I SAM-dependent methyltransferase [Chryseobacterium rhizoplanae]|uniref:class I SAM-dependent methyltransferase n=1 Tax=Chryseobacterium rhizoplanae TaxID=1609531 RepID=UPI001CE349CC|nr:class I SAM-dependent methyltransferase [Chryseobacterium rhizoplanae]UCA61828.1 class I SAM-dependent methyltransferase [Chryseobacterium rhizoplanae]
MYNKGYSEIDGVKIYIENIESYIAESYLLLTNHNKYNEFSLHKYINQEKRKEYFNSLVQAYLHNYNNIRELLAKVKPYVEVDRILNVNTSRDNVVNTTLKDYVYLQRDWCYCEDGEAQIEKTAQSIQKVLPRDMENALFLGCGVGRLAVEFANIFKKVLATDKSYSMIWHINKLLSDVNFEFYTPQEKNVYSLENVAQKHTASISDSLKTQIKDKVDFFVSDVLDLPLKKNSLDAVFSIYFTDVIALKLWFEKINSIIKNDGYFIHFGPLDYFFSAESEMLTAKEFRAFFEENGYETVVDEIIETSHLNDSNSLVYKVYRNWLFVAKK